MKRGLALLAACATAVIALLGPFAAARARHPMPPIDVPAPGPTPVVEVNLISFDPAIGDVYGRLHLRLPANMIGKNETPTEDLLFVDATTVDESILKIPAAPPYSYYDSFINARYQVDDPGSEFMYPFDEHETNLHFFVSAARGKRLIPLPIAYDCSNCDFDGYHVTVRDGGTTATDVRLHVAIRRSLPIVCFSVFIILGMWAITIVIVVLAARVVRRRKKAPEVATMGFIGGLLFAFPAIRAAQPSVPPVGVISDYLGFFGCEFALMFTLVAVMVAWLRFPEAEDW